MIVCEGTYVSLLRETPLYLRISTYYVHEIERKEMKGGSCEPTMAFTHSRRTTQIRQIADDMEEERQKLADEVEARLSSRPGPPLIDGSRPLSSHYHKLHHAPVLSKESVIMLQCAMWESRMANNSRP